MYTLFRKEIVQFLGSVTGYLAVVVFLLTGGLFLWVFPGIYNIPESGYATLEPWFMLAPWLYLFLVPAITMRLFADEKRSGTLELLLTRPLGDLKLVSAKFLAALVLVGFSLLPTLLWFWSVSRLGNPPGNIDGGSTWGAFIGLFLLASVYIAIGLFASVITDSQIVAFILAMAISFLFYLGFDFIAGTGLPYGIEKTVAWFSIDDHYRSLSRGVIDAGDFLYFAGMTLFFLLLTTVFLRKSRNSLRKAWTWVAGLATGLILLLVMSGKIPYRIDLTAEKRYSVASVSKRVVRSLDEPVTVELFLAGELPPGFRKLQQAIGAKVKDLERYSRKPIRLVITDPYKAVRANEREAFFNQLANNGIRPTDLRRQTEGGTSTSLIFPGARISCGDRTTGVSFLKNNPGVNHEVNLNHSVEGVEYELVSALQRLMARQKPLLVFLQGHEELNPYEVEDLALSLTEFFRVEFMNPALLEARDTIPDVLVIARPELPFPETDKFVIDQLLMRGSRILWALDPVEVSLDSLSQGYMTLAFPRDLNLNDQLFHYGIRINADLVQDVACAHIMVSTSLSDSRPEFTPQPWYYSPLLTPSEKHPVSRNLNLIYGEFVSSIDTVGSSGERKATPLLTTSPYGRRVRTPAAVSLENINRPPARELFNQPFIITGILLEGRFTSVFRNRMLDHLGIPSASVIEASPETRMMVFSDGDLMANKVRYEAGKEPRILPLGYDRVSRQTFGNKELFVNAIRFLADEGDITQLRNAAVKMRLLDKVRITGQRRALAWLNTGVPLGIVLLFALFFGFFRKRKYSKAIS